MIAQNITDYSQQKPKQPAVQMAQTARMTSKEEITVVPLRRSENRYDQM